MRSLRLRMSRCSSAVGRRGGCPPGIVNHARTAHERTKIAHVHHQALTGGRGWERGRPRFGTAGVVCRNARRFSAIAAFRARARECLALFALEWRGVSPVLKKYAMPLGIWLLFAAIAVGLWLGLKNIF